MTRVDLTAGILALGAERFCDMVRVRDAAHSEGLPR